MRYKFNEIFKENPDDTLTPLHKIRVGVATIGPNTNFSKNAIFGGINFFEYKGHYLEAEKDEEGIIVITGIY